MNRRTKFIFSVVAVLAIAVALGVVFFPTLGDDLMDCAAKPLSYGVRVCAASAQLKLWGFAVIVALFIVGKRYGK